MQQPTVNCLASAVGVPPFSLASRCCGARVTRGAERPWFSPAGPCKNCAAPLSNESAGRAWARPGPSIRPFRGATVTVAQELQPGIGAGAGHNQGEEDRNDLIVRAARGDEAAFARLYQRDVDTIYRYLLFKVGDPAVAEDLTSEAFVRAWQALPRYQHRQQPLRHWLLRIARNLAVDHFRRQAMDRAAVDELSQAVPLVAGPPPLSESEELEAALRTLPPSQREVIVLRFLEDLPTSDVARIVGKSEGAVRVIQHRALRALRALLAAAHQPRGA